MWGERVPLRVDGIDCSILFLPSSNAILLVGVVSLAIRVFPKFVHTVARAVFSYCYYGFFVFSVTWQERNHLHGRFDPRDLHSWPQLQGGQQLFVAVQIEQSSRWVPAEDPALHRGW